MNKTQIVKMLKQGSVFFGIIPNMITDYSFNEDDQEYIIDCGAQQIRIPNNAMIYFYKNPGNNEYEMRFMPGEKVGFILFHHSDIDEMIDFNEIDFNRLRISSIEQLSNLKCAIDVQSMEDE